MMSLAERVDVITVVLVDDHELARQGARAMLSQDPDIHVVGEASNDVEAVAVIRQLRPDVVMLDVRLGDRSGLNVVAACRCDVPGTKFILLTAYEDDPYARRMGQLGVHGLLQKCVSREELLGSVHYVAGGGVMRHAYGFSHEVNLASEAGGVCRADACAEHLSLREKEVLRLVSSGLRNQQIADALGISLKTVEVHVGHILLKSGARSRTEVAVRFRRNVGPYVPTGSAG